MSCIHVGDKHTTDRFKVGPSYHLPKGVYLYLSECNNRVMDIKY